MSRSSSPTAAPEGAGYTLGRWFTAARREGLLALLSPDVWHTLSAILSFTCRDGRRIFTVDQLAVALGQSPEAALTRLDQLTDTRWRDEPLAVLDRDPSGEIVGATLAPLEVLSGAKAPLPAEAPLPLPEFTNEQDKEASSDFRGRLEEAGVNPDQIAWLLKSFPPERICRQLEWLPQRQARNPAALLIRAIEGDWGPPREGV